MNTPRIVFIGHVCVDHNTVEGTTYSNWGSPAMFMTKYFQSVFRTTPTIIASYGQDFVPFTSDVNLYPSEPNLSDSLTYENIVKDGHRTQYCHHAISTTPPIIDETAQRVIKQADIVFFAPLTPHFSVEYVQDLAAYIPKSCLRVLLPQGYMRHIDDQGLVSPREFTEASDIIPLFDLVTLSDEDHPKAIIRSHEWKKLSPTTDIIVTRNARGADIVHHDSVNHIPTKPVAAKDIIDSVGCGDVFTAATAMHLQKTGNLEAAIKAGHTAARAKLLALNKSGSDTH